jgi:thiol-disulfide isomerase/thioredoxin/outer membrane lipoprotein-sorting protein
MTLNFIAHLRPSRPLAPRVPALVAGFLFSTLTALAQVSTPNLDARTAETFQSISEFYAGQTALTARISTTMRMQAQGLTNEATITHEFSALRPNRLRLISHTQRPNSGSPPANSLPASELVSNGSLVFAHLPALRKYTASPAPPHLDQILHTGDLVLMQSGPASTFLAALVSQQPRTSLLESVTNGAYVGPEKIGTRDTHRFRLIQTDMDWDLWVAAGPRPEVLRIVPDLSKALARSATLPEARESDRPIQMEFVVEFHDWTFPDTHPPERFAFTPPAGTEKVDTFFDAPEPESVTSSLLGRPAPDLQLDLLPKGKLDLSSHRGKEIVVLDFWATWCGPCLRALPILTEVSDAFRNRGVRFYAVNQEEERTEIETFLSKHQWSLTVALDPEGRAGRAYQVTGIPQTVIIGRDGIVEAVHIGLLPNLKARLTQELETLLAGQTLADRQP